jgi:hypothetical protein
MKKGMEAAVLRQQQEQRKQKADRAADEKERQ